ncbi:MAG: flagellar hook protein FlgE [Bacteriovoracales bacterium]|nr:flagellar hook protein FlgE [Bacteriovoracales bacterium]
MSILRSFNIGISGLSSTGRGMGVVSDNIANAGTFGFKSSRPEFQDTMAASLRGIDGGDQLGSGTQISHITPIFSQGPIQRTELTTDVAVSGNGFFKLKAPFGFAYTRDGSFRFNKDGYLINGDGYRVQGLLPNSKGEISNKEGFIRLGNTTIRAKATENIEMNMNIDSREMVQEFDLKRPDETSSYRTSITVYDNVGIARLVTFFFNKTSDNVWEYRAMSDGMDVPGGKKGEWVEQGSGTLVFNERGELQEEKIKDDIFNFNKGAAKDQKIKLSFGVSIAEGGNGLDASTQFGTRTTLARYSQDGSTAAELGSLSFSDNGILLAVYNNGETKNVGQLGLAKFQNNEGLFKVGRNLFKQTQKSGQPAFGQPTTGGRGSVLSKSIELSNVDVANEFVNLMTAQRNFQANARTITTADKMLQEVLNLKR